MDLDTYVGININLNIGQLNKASDFRTDHYDTRWPLYSTCMGFGLDFVPAPTLTAENRKLPARTASATTIIITTAPTPTMATE